jgi:hypothetical protein
VRHQQEWLRNWLVASCNRKDGGGVQPEAVSHRCNRILVAPMAKPDTPSRARMNHPIAIPWPSIASGVDHRRNTAIANEGPEHNSLIGIVAQPPGNSLIKEVVLELVWIDIRESLFVEPRVTGIVCDVVI